jgi:hypothetical protein
MFDELSGYDVETIKTIVLILVVFGVLGLARMQR